MVYAIATVLFLVLIFGPQIWVRYVFKKYSVEIEELPGTGGELARHLLDKLQIKDSVVEETVTDGDHYDPDSKAVRLSPQVYHGKSLTAITIAAHECGHALQHHTGYQPLYLRWKCARFVATAEKMAALILVATPLLALITRIPQIGVISLLAGFSFLFMPVLFHLITLPVEFNASFGRALPLLVHGKYIPASAIPISRKLLTAAALTYVSAALASLLNFYRWMIFLRR